jgi:O-antigen ligase
MVLDAQKMERVLIILSKNRQFDFNQMIHYIALAYALVLPLSRAGITFFTGVLVLLWVLDGHLIGKIKQLFKNNIVVALTFFIFFNFVSLLWTENVVETLGYIRRYWYLLPILVFATTLKKEYLSKVLSAFILGMFISEIISYGIFFELWQVNCATPENPSPFMHHIEYSIFLAFTALVLLSRIFNHGDMKYKLLYAFFFITISGNLFLTAGRTGQFAFVLGLFVLALVSFKNKFKAFSISFVLAALILGIAFNVSTTFHDRVITGKENLVSVIDNKDYCTSWGGRVGAWIISKDIITEHPLLGMGVVDNMKEFHKIIDTKYPEMNCMHESFMHVHNQYFQIFTQLGLLGLLIFLSIFYFIVKLPLRSAEHSRMRYVYLTVLLFAFVSEVIFHRQFSMVLFAFIIGILLAQHRIENEV